MAKKSSPEKPTEKKPRTKKPAATEAKVKAVDGKGADTSQIGHNSRVPDKKELAPFFNRLETLHEQKAAKNAEFMSDIKGVYEDAANKLGVSRKVFRTLFQKKRSEESFADWLAELEQKETDDADRLMAGCATAFGKDTPFGAWAAAQGEVRGKTAKQIDEVQPPPTKIVETAAQAAARIMKEEDAKKGGDADKTS